MSLYTSSPRLQSIADTVEIAPGVHLPRLGLGTWRARDADVQREIRLGLEIGYRLIDTSANYRNEAEIADELQRAGIPREELFITTKLESEDFGYMPTKRALDASLARLQTDYVDLYLIHWPGPGYCCDTWRAMEELVGEGKTRSIGVSNFEPSDLAEIDKTATIGPAVNQIELHPYRQRPEIVRACRERGITVQAWGPVMRGHAGEVPTLHDIAMRHGKTAAQVSIRWILQNGFVTIPKSVHEERLRENADVFDFELSAEEMDAIARLDRNQHVG